MEPLNFWTGYLARHVFAIMLGLEDGGRSTGYAMWLTGQVFRRVDDQRLFRIYLRDDFRGPGEVAALQRKGDF